MEEKKVNINYREYNSAKELPEMDKELLKKALSFPGVYDYILQNSSDEALKNMLRAHR